MNTDAMATFAPVLIPLFLAMGCDVTNAAQVDAAIGEVEAQWGPVTVYVHNAAPLHMGAFADTDPSTFEALWRTMCLGAVHWAQRVLPGIPAFEALPLAGSAVNNRAMAASFAAAEDIVRGGKTVADALRRSGVFDSQTGYAFTSTGQYAGSLDDMLERYGRMLDEQASSYADQLSEWTPRIIYFLIIGLVAGQILGFWSNYMATAGEPR
jgi:NAD(P)-dependent dehydrogenase (short-subunit alcohol dehydrogenase family)